MIKGILYHEKTNRSYILLKNQKKLRGIDLGYYEEVIEAKESNDSFIHPVYGTTKRKTRPLHKHGFYLEELKDIPKDENNKRTKINDSIVLLQGELGIRLRMILGLIKASSFSGKMLNIVKEYSPENYTKIKDNKMSYDVEYHSDYSIVERGRILKDNYIDEKSNCLFESGTYYLFNFDTLGSNNKSYPKEYYLSSIRKLYDKQIREILVAHGATLKSTTKFKEEKITLEEVENVVQDTANRVANLVSGTNPVIDGSTTTRVFGRFADFLTESQREQAAEERQQRIEESNQYSWRVDTINLSSTGSF